VSSLINTTDPQVVNDEVDRIYLDLYPSAPTRPLDHAFRDLTRLYRGEFPGYRRCDTAYHDVQHVLDVTLAMARLIDGYERTRGGTPAFNARSAAVPAAWPMAKQGPETRAEDWPSCVMEAQRPATNRLSIAFGTIMR